MTGVAFVNTRYMKGMPFLPFSRSKRVYKRIRGEASVGGGGRGVPPRIKLCQELCPDFVEYPPGIIHT